jgi:hypothetical protein
MTAQGQNPRQDAHRGDEEERGDVSPHYLVDRSLRGMEPNDLAHQWAYQCSPRYSDAHNDQQDAEHGMKGLFRRHDALIVMA